MSYVTAEDMVVFLRDLFPAIQESDITSILFSASFDEINQRSETTWQVTSVNQLADGRGSSVIFCPIVPIQTLTAVIIIAKDETEESLIISGTDRQIWFDNETGKIEIILGSTGIEVSGNEESPFKTSRVFPKGVRNIRMEGTFGRTTVPATVSFLQMLIILKYLSFQHPTRYAVDLIQEKIGRYSKAFGVPANQAVQNQKRGIDGMIEYLYSVLPQDDAIWIEAV